MLWRRPQKGGRTELLSGLDQWKLDFLLKLTNGANSAGTLSHLPTSPATSIVNVCVVLYVLQSLFIIIPFILRSVDERQAKTQQIKAGHGIFLSQILLFSVLPAPPTPTLSPLPLLILC